MLSAACLDAINALVEIERDRIRAALLANPSLHMLLPLFEILYERGSGELWYYDESGNFVESHFCRTCVRHDCVLDAFLFCLAIYHFYATGGACGQHKSHGMMSYDVKRCMRKYGPPYISLVTFLL
jgi:hypothetical protein